MKKIIHLVFCSMAMLVLTLDAQAATHAAVTNLTDQTWCVIGTINGFWDTDTEMTLIGDNVYSATFTDLAAGTYEYKVRTKGSWDVNYGQDGIFEGPNMSVTVTGDLSTVIVYFDAVTHIITHEVLPSDPTWCVIGTINGNWDTDTEMTKTEGSLYKAVIINLAPGTYEYKIRTKGSWDVNYGQDGIFEGSNIPVTVAEDLSSVAIYFDSETHAVNHEVLPPAYSVIGDFDTWQSDYDMTKGDDGLYSVVIADLAAGTYKYRVRANHDWTHQYNQYGECDATGEYAEAVVQSDGATIVIYFDPVTKTTTAVTTAGDEPEPYAAISDDGQTVTFYYDCLKTSRRGVAINNDERDPAYNNCQSAVFDTSFADYRPTTTAYWFYYCEALTAVSGIENLNTDEVTDMSHMFRACRNLTSLDLTSLNTSRVTDMGYMLRDCSSLTSINLSGLDTGAAEDMSGMFEGCNSLVDLDLSSLNTAKVKDMHSMFEKCHVLAALNLSNLNTSSVETMLSMFENCRNLTSLDLGSFNTVNVTDMDDMFGGDSALTTIYVSPELWSTASVTDGMDVFAGCTSLVGGQGTVYDAGHVDYTYARVDGGTALPGYLTAKGSAIDLQPIAGDTTIDTGILAGKDLTDTVVDDVYYNLGSDAYDAGEGAIVISQPTNMSQISDATPGSADVKELFTGIILKVAAGAGTLTVNTRTTGNAQIVVQVGDNTPAVATQAERDDVVVNYNAEADTYVYIYSVGGSSEAHSGLMRARAASANDVYIYSICIKAGTAAIGTATLPSTAVICEVYSLDGRCLETLHKGINIVRTEDGRMSKIVVR